MTSYRDLDVWKKSYALSLAVYRATEAFPKNEMFGLTSQLRRAAVSIPANTAEGYCRHSRNDYMRFVAIAQGSAGELDTLLSRAHDLTYLEAPIQQHLAAMLSDVGKMLTRLRQSLYASESREPRAETRMPAPERREPNAGSR